MGYADARWQILGVSLSLQQFPARWRHRLRASRALRPSLGRIHSQPLLSSGGPTFTGVEGWESSTTNSVNAGNALGELQVIYHLSLSIYNK